MSQTTIRMIAIAAIVCSLAIIAATKLYPRVQNVNQPVAVEAAAMITADECAAMAKQDAPSTYSAAGCFVWKDGAWQEVTK